MSANPVDRDPYVVRALSILIRSAFTRELPWTPDDPAVVRLSVLLEQRDEALGPVTGNAEGDAVTVFVYVQDKSDPIILRDVDREAAEFAQDQLFITSLLGLELGPVLLRSFNTKETLANITVLTRVSSLVITPQPKVEAIGAHMLANQRKRH